MKQKNPWQDPVKQKLEILSSAIELLKSDHEDHDRVAKELEAKSLTSFQNFQIRDDFRASADRFAAMLRELEAFIRAAAVPSYSSTDPIGPLCLIRVETVSVTDEMMGGPVEPSTYWMEPYEVLTWFDLADPSSRLLAEYERLPTQASPLAGFKGRRVGSTFSEQGGGRPGEGFIVERKIVAIA